MSTEHRFVFPLGRTRRPAPVPDLSFYDLLAPHLSGGKDSAVMNWVFMEAAQEAGVADRVISCHCSLGVLEWLSVLVDGVRHPEASPPRGV